MNSIVRKYSDLLIFSLKNEMLSSGDLLGDKRHNEFVEALFSNIDNDNIAIKIIASFLLSAMKQSYELKNSESAKWLFNCGITKFDIRAYNSICKAKTLKTFEKRLKAYYRAYDKKSYEYKQLHSEIFTAMSEAFHFVRNTYEN